MSREDRKLFREPRCAVSGGNLLPGPRRSRKAARPHDRRGPFASECESRGKRPVIVDVRPHEAHRAQQCHPSGGAFMVALRFLTCLCCMTLSACVYQRPGFPGDWAPLETGQTDCSALNGVYMNVGVRVNPDNKRSSGRLGPLLFQEFNRWDLNTAVHNVEVAVACARTIFFEGALIKAGMLSASDYRPEAPALDQPAGRRY